mmetsp:Transcript_56804/g.161188  ORF Transcript_56804/g.161188 Transcript_56804/m.161188 type:complete len:178 (-) Transcript_56804:192-725(-)
MPALGGSTGNSKKTSAVTPQSAKEEWNTLVAASPACAQIGPEPSEEEEQALQEAVAAQEELLEIQQEAEAEPKTGRSIALPTSPTTAKATRRSLASALDGMGDRGDVVEGARPGSARAGRPQASFSGPVTISPKATVAPKADALSGQIDDRGRRARGARRRSLQTAPRSSIRRTTRR